MTTPDYTHLENIFQMMSPISVYGTSKSSFGQDNDNAAYAVFKALFEQPGGGAVTIQEMRKSLQSLLSGVSEEEKKKFSDVIRIYSSEGHGIDSSEWYTKIQSSDQTSLVKLGDFRTIIGSKVSLSERNKKMSLIQSTSNFITPGVRKTSAAELFLNFIPTHVAQRCVPYLSAEFVFDRPVNGTTKLSTPSLLKFLLGSRDTSEFLQGSANDILFNGNKIVNEQSEQHVMGMEMFTSPQTLLNPTRSSNSTRYVDILDQFRPFASIENLTVNVTPTVGTFSYKKATLTLKLHDRSRLTEIADLIKPLVYTKTTVWLTYGWRHPVEKNNQYANFINDNMLTREPYGIVNASYTFDAVGQVSVVLELFTKGIRELRDIRITGLSESFEDIKRQIASLAEDIATYRQQLNLDKPTGLNKEIRSYQVLEAAERGEFPDLKPIEVQGAISSLQKSLSSTGGRVDSSSANKLVDTLKKLYAFNGTNKEQRFNFKERMERQVSATVNSLFDELSMGPDPFLMSSLRDSERIQKIGGKPHPFSQLIDQYHKVRSTQTSETKLTFRRRIVSFGKIFSVFVGRGVVSIQGLDEMQIIFYNFNERAGRAASVNIAEFPVDLSIFYEQFKEHVEQYRSDHITLEEFMKLVIRAQLGDVRGVGYGFFSYFEPFDPKNNDAQLKKNQEQNFENAYAAANDKKGPFKMPAIEVYVESTYATSSGKKADLLTTFEQAAKVDFGRKVEQYSRVLRIHVYDKQVNPYPLATSLLKRDDASPINAQFTRQELLSDQYKDAIVKGFNGLPSDIQEKLRQSKDHGVVIDDLVSNDKIKKFVSKLLPTLVYGTNASGISTANVASKQDPMLTSVQMMANRSGRPSVTQPNGGGTNGLPLRVIPTSMTINTLGCPLLDFMQLWFIDFNTGTSIDNVYGVTGLTHTITPGKFDSQMTMTFYDAYGQYESPATLLQQVAQIQIPE